MRFKFMDGEPFTINKVPHQNIVEAKVAGKTLKYERAVDGLKKLTEESDHREPEVVALIIQHFMPAPRYRRSKISTNLPTQAFQNR